MNLVGYCVSFVRQAPQKNLFQKRCCNTLSGRKWEHLISNDRRKEITFEEFFQGQKELIKNTDQDVIRWTKNAFYAFQKHDAWDYLEKPFEKDFLYTFEKDPTQNKITSELEADGHTGWTMAGTLRALQTLYKMRMADESQKLIKPYLE